MYVVACGNSLDNLPLSTSISAFGRDCRCGRLAFPARCMLGTVSRPSRASWVGQRVSSQSDTQRCTMNPFFYGSPSFSAGRFAINPNSPRPAFPAPGSIPPPFYGLPLTVTAVAVDAAAASVTPARPSPSVPAARAPNPAATPTSAATTHVPGRNSNSNPSRVQRLASYVSTTMVPPSMRPPATPRPETTPPARSQSPRPHPSPTMSASTTPASGQHPPRASGGQRDRSLHDFESNTEQSTTDENGPAQPAPTTATPRAPQPMQGILAQAAPIPVQIPSQPRTSRPSYRSKAHPSKQASNPPPATPAPPATTNPATPAPLVAMTPSTSASQSVASQAACIPSTAALPSKRAGSPEPTPSRKRKAYDLALKRKVIEYRDSPTGKKMTLADIARQFDITSRTSIREWCTEERQRIVEESANPETKRHVQAILTPDVEMRLVTFIRDNVEHGFPITGPIVCEQARQWHEEAQNDLPEEARVKFFSSEGWLTGFKGRHGIQEYKLHGSCFSCTFFEYVLAESV